MGKKLSSWEVSSRRRERERERENAASTRRSEREGAARIRLQEKERASAIRARERQSVRDEKEGARRQEVERREYEQTERENLVVGCERYLRDLQRLHAMDPVDSASVGHIAENAHYELCLQLITTGDDVLPFLTDHVGASAGHILQPITTVSRGRWIDAYRSRAVARPRVPNQFQPEVLPGLEYKEVTPSPCSFFKSRAFAWAGLASMTTAMLLVWWVARFRTPRGGNWTTALTIAAIIWLLVTSSSVVTAVLLRMRNLVRWHGKLEEAQRAAQKQIADNEAAIQADFQTRQDRRMALFQQTEEQLESQWNDNEEQRLELLGDAQEGSAAAVALLVEAILPLDFQVRSPEELGTSDLRDHEVGYQVFDGTTLGLRILLPSSDVVPAHRLELTPTGQKVKQLVIARNERSRLYLSMASSLSLAYILRCIQAVPFLQRVVIEATANGVDGSTGHEIQQSVVSVDLVVDHLENLLVSKVDPVEALTRLGAQFGMQTALVNSEQVTWASRDDTALGLPTGLTDLGQYPENSNPHAELPEDHHRYLAECAARRAKVTGDTREQIPLPAGPSPLHGAYLFLVAIATPLLAVAVTLPNPVSFTPIPLPDGGLPPGDAQTLIGASTSAETPLIMPPGRGWFCWVDTSYEKATSSCARERARCERSRQRQIQDYRQHHERYSVARCRAFTTASCHSFVSRSLGVRIPMCYSNLTHCEEDRQSELDRPSAFPDQSEQSRCSSVE